MDQHPPRVLCLWPGLPGLWLRGQWTSLMLAAGFSLLLNAALAGSFVWPDLMGRMFPVVAWPVLAIVWSLSTWHSWRTAARFAGTPEAPAPDDDVLFIQAQTEYLNGNWVQCEQLLVKRLRICPRDLESRLLLATTLRRSNRPDAARRQLEALRRIDGWQQWETEIGRELQALDNRLNDESASDSAAGEEPAEPIAENEAPEGPGATTEQPPGPERDQRSARAA